MSAFSRLPAALRSGGGDAAPIGAGGSAGGGVLSADGGTEGGDGVPDSSNGWPIGVEGCSYRTTRTEESGLFACTPRCTADGPEACAGADGGDGVPDTSNGWPIGVVSAGISNRKERMSASGARVCPEVPPEAAVGPEGGDGVPASSYCTVGLAGTAHLSPPLRRCGYLHVHGTPFFCRRQQEGW